MMTRRGFSLAIAGAAGLTHSRCGSDKAAAPIDSALKAEAIRLPEPAPVDEVEVEVRGSDFHRGVNFTAERRDRYDSENTKKLLRSLPEYGIDSIALVPYGFNRKGSTEIRLAGRRSWERDDAIRNLTAIAHESGMRVLLKPQLWVPRAFPGEIDFPTEPEAAEWFRGYELFLDHYAKLATTSGADLFSVGVEFSKMIRYEEAWRRLIARARELYAGPLIYAANWGDEFESVAFWDDLDLIGLNNYYPLPDDLNTDAVVDAVRKVHQKFDRPVVFPEAGYPSLKAAHKEPWSEEAREISVEDQARCYEATLRAFYHKPWFQGVYWWKVGSNGRGGPNDGSHSPWRKPAMDVVAKWYLRGGKDG